MVSGVCCLLHRYLSIRWFKLPKNFFLNWSARDSYPVKLQSLIFPTTCILHIYQLQLASTFFGIKYEVTFRKIILLRACICYSCFSFLFSLSSFEIARILASAQCFKPDFSVMFVVFDAEESGCKGSQEFIASHLKPHLKITGGSIQGAYILDTLLNYDSRPGSQHYSKVSSYQHYAHN